MGFSVKKIRINRNFYDFSLLCSHQKCVTGHVSCMPAKCWISGQCQGNVLDLMATSLKEQCLQRCPQMTSRIFWSITPPLSYFLSPVMTKSLMHDYVTSLMDLSKVSNSSALPLVHLRRHQLGLHPFQKLPGVNFTNILWQFFVYKR